MDIIDLKNTDLRSVIKKAAQVFKTSGLVVYPTETCYGVGVDVTNKVAVEKLLKYKGKRGGKATSVAVSDQAMAEQYVVLNKTAKNLYRNFLPGPLTVVSQSKGKVIPVLQAGKESLGIRIPDYPLILKIVRCLNKPITSTSANTSGKKPPYSLTDWQKYTSQKKQAMVDLFLDAGYLPERQPSTVVDTTLNEARVLREGKIKIAGKKATVYLSHSEKQTQALGAKLFDQYKSCLSQKPLIFALQGELGAGKTQLAKGVAKALGIKANVVSPTFVLVREYPFKKAKLYHLDTWRLEKGKDFWDLGFKAMLQPGNVIVIEWLEKVKSLLEDLKEAKIVWVDIEILSKDKRKFSYC